VTGSRQRRCPPGDHVDDISLGELEIEHVQARRRGQDRPPSSTLAAVGAYRLGQKVLSAVTPVTTGRRLAHLVALLHRGTINLAQQKPLLDMLHAETSSVKNMVFSVYSD
jgi:hypothetical protein